MSGSFIELIIIREWPKTIPILRNLDNFPPDAFYSTPRPYNRDKRMAKWKQKTKNGLD